MNTLTFREKSILCTLLATVAVTAGYFLRVTPLLLSGAPLWEFLWPAVTAIVVTIVIQIIYQILLTIIDKEVPADERDRLVDLHATRVAHFVLCAGCVSMLVLTINCSIFDWPITAALVVHAICVVMTLSDIARGVAQIVGYRTLA